jgi:hypothetical protein
VQPPVGVLPLLNGRGGRRPEEIGAMNLHCPVNGCKTQQPHTDDPIVQALRQMPPKELTDLVRAAMAELLESFKNDAQNNRTFAWMTRLRQVDELYMRTVYILLLAKDEEIPHVLSGDTPNGFDFIYAAFNRAVLDGRGELKETKPGFKFGTFTPMKTIHNATHVSFQTLITWRSSKQYPESVQGFPEKYVGHVEKCRLYLDQVGKLLGAGRDKSLVLKVLRNMHSPIPNPS